MTKHATDHMLTVAQAIKMLKELPQDAYVVLSSDSEGNNFSPLTNSVGEGLYIADSTWSGQWYSEEDKEEYGYDEENAHKAVFLFPVN